MQRKGRLPACFARGFGLQVGPYVRLPACFARGFGLQVSHLDSRVYNLCHVIYPANLCLTMISYMFQVTMMIIIVIGMLSTMTLYTKILPKIKWLIGVCLLLDWDFIWYLTIILNPKMWRGIKFQDGKMHVNLMGFGFVARIVWNHFITWCTQPRHAFAKCMFWIVHVIFLFFNGLLLGSGLDGVECCNKHCLELRIWLSSATQCSFIL